MPTGWAECGTVAHRCGEWCDARRNCGNAMQMLQEMMDGTLQEKKDAKDEGLFEDEDWMLQVGGWVRL